MRAREAEAAGETCGAKPPERTWHGAWDQGGGREGGCVPHLSWLLPYVVYRYQIKKKLRKAKVVGHLTRAKMRAKCD